MSIPLIINQGTQEEFNKIIYYTVGSIYVCTDTGNVYLGTEETKCIQLANTANFIGTTPASNVAQKDQIENVLAAHAGLINDITTDYLPLTGGTMTGNIETASNIDIKANGEISIAQGAQINLTDGGKIKLAAQNENIENSINSDEPIRYDIYKTFKDGTSSSISTLESSLSSERETRAQVDSQLDKKITTAKSEAISTAAADATTKANAAESIANTYTNNKMTILTGTTTSSWNSSTPTLWGLHNLTETNEGFIVKKFDDYATIEYVDNAINTLQNDLATELGTLL